MGLKEEKEAFMTGHKGTTVSEILLVCMSAPIGIFLYHELRNYLAKIRRKGSGNLPLHIGVFLEAITILLPMAICQTKLLHPAGVALLVFEASLAATLHLMRTKTRSSVGAKITEIIPNDNQNHQEKLDFLTFYRSTVSYLTFVAILAVDFPIFPRSFAKTEVSGYGLMDLGAGSFCVSGGFVSWFARRKREEASTNTSEIHRFQKVVIRCIPLLVMGFVRLLTTKGLEYQEHVSEYGVHWNFFFTLSVVGVLSTFLRAILKMKNSVWWFVILITYQIILSSHGADLQSYIEEAPRRCDFNGDFILVSSLSSMPVLCNFLAANREGIWGCIGYSLLHLAGEDIATYCLWNFKENLGQRRRGQRLAFVTTFFWSIHWVLVSLMGIPVSRRSTNASFIVWTIAHNMTILFATWGVFYLGCPKLNSKSNIEVNPPIFAAVNRHGLIVFILANLMTGAVNLSIDTLKVSDATAIGVIVVYLCAVGAVGLILDYKPQIRKRKVKK